MVTIDTLRHLAMSLPEVTEEPHFDKTSFRVRKKIFVSYDALFKRACIKLSVIDQDVFSAFDDTTIFPVDNKWGKQGWTFIEMEKVKPEIFLDAITTAYCEVAPKKIAVRVSSDHNAK
jgi:hypothetical protein